MSRSNCCFLTCIQISQEAGQVVLYSHRFQNFPQFMVIHTVKGFAVLKPGDNQCIYLMKMFILSYANALCIYPKLYLQIGSASWFRTYLTNQYVIFRYCSPNLCKWNYLYGNLPFYKIQVNHLMAQNDSSGAKIIPKCILWVRGLPGAILSFKTFLSFINRLLVTI